MQDLQFSYEQHDQMTTIPSPLYTLNRAQQ